MTYRKKAKKKRRTHGYGSKKKHRGKGSKGGKGYAGSHKHKYSYIVKYEPNHFGFKGFISLKSKPKTINVGDLERFETTKINLSFLGYEKLLGKGNITKAFEIKVKSSSKRAKEKIESAGGKVNIG